MGITHIRLAAAEEDALMGALTTAWKHRIQKNDATARRSPRRTLQR
jgi:hypothetical protein